MKKKFLRILKKSFSPTAYIGDLIIKYGFNEDDYRFVLWYILEKKPIYEFISKKEIDKEFSYFRHHYQLIKDVYGDSYGKR